MEPNTVEPATIVNLDTQETIRCLFNPKEYTFSKQNTWNTGSAKGANLGKSDFGGGQPAQLTMQLFFDTFEAGTDVRKHTDKIWSLMLVDEKKADKKNKKSRPPDVRFQWGTSWSFDAVVVSITQKFTLFLPTGAPVRATLDVTFRQIKDKKQQPKQNPTSGNAGGGRLWTVTEGDSLAGIAAAEYGDPNLWRRIADANHLTNVRRLRSGQVLEIPSA